MKIEYGGCLPLEQLFINQNPFLKYSHQTFNSGRSAILGAIKDYKAERIWLPYYMCPTIKKFLHEHNISVKEYYLNSDYTPNLREVRKDEMILWANWYGCMKEEIIEKVKREYGGQLILDNAQALFYVPDIKNFDGYYIYSCRKFIGVPDGAYLIKKNLKNRMYHLENFFDYDWRYLDMSLVKGSNSQYLNYQKNEQIMENSFNDMSNLTKEYLKVVPWKKIIRSREKNFYLMHTLLRKKNLLNINFNSSTAFMYPFMQKKDGLREYLIDKSIFVPTWWKHLLELKNENVNEYKWTKYIIPIPIDQRYNRKDVERIAKIILEYLE